MCQHVPCRALSPAVLGYCVVHHMRGSFSFQPAASYCSLSVRSGTAGLLINVEYSKIRNNSWMYLTSFVITRISIELAAVQRKLPDYVVVGLQLYSARIFHVTLSPRIYKGGQGPPPNNHQHLKQYKPPHMT